MILLSYVQVHQWQRRNPGRHLPPELLPIRPHPRQPLPVLTQAILSQEKTAPGTFCAPSSPSSKGELAIMQKVVKLARGNLHAESRSRVVDGSFEKLCELQAEETAAQCVQFAVQVPFAIPGAGRAQ